MIAPARPQRGPAVLPEGLANPAELRRITYDRWLRPLGYPTEARIVDDPGGKPGDVGLFISC